jgi:hypothetical protein
MGQSIGEAQPAARTQQCCLGPRTCVKSMTRSQSESILFCHVCYLRIEKSEDPYTAGLDLAATLKLPTKLAMIILSSTTRVRSTTRAMRSIRPRGGLERRQIYRLPLVEWLQ